MEGRAVYPALDLIGKCAVSKHIISLIMDIPDHIVADNSKLHIILINRRVNARVQSYPGNFRSRYHRTQIHIGFAAVGVKTDRNKKQTFFTQIKNMGVLYMNRATPIELDITDKESVVLSPAAYDVQDTL